MAANVEIRKVLCEERVLEYQLTRKDVKNVNLRIKPDGRILVSANVKVPVLFIDDFIKQKQTFIIKVLDRCEEKRKYQVEYPRQYVSGESYRILGKNLRLKVVEASTEEVFSDGVFVFLKVKYKDDFHVKEKLINQWLKEYRNRIFGEVCAEIYPIFKKYEIAYPTIKIRSMTSRWGSCHTKKNIITLNSKLIEAPRRCIEYVMLHEFAHFIHPNHSKQFYSFVEMLMPDWKERKEELNRLI